MTAADVKAALRKRHPAGDGVTEMLGPWTVLEEWHAIDAVAFCAWTRSKQGTAWPLARHPIVGYEVKVSRADYRRELLRPFKRAGAVAFCTEFFFAVPAGLLTADELAFVEPQDLDREEDFRRPPCTGEPLLDEVGEPGRRRCLGGSVFPAGDDREPPRVRACSQCDGKGYADRSRVEREFPKLWVPRDVGLIEITPRGCRVARRPPKPASSVNEPAKIARRREMAELARWASFRPDPRHRNAAA